MVIKRFKFTCTHKIIKLFFILYDSSPNIIVDIFRYQGKKFGENRTINFSLLENDVLQSNSLLKLNRW